MKHLFSLCCAILCTVTLMAAKATKVSFNFMTANSLEHYGEIISGEDPLVAKKGDFNFMLQQRDENFNETLVAQIFVSTASGSVTNLVGAYGIAATLPVYSTVHVGESSYRAKSGAFFIECIGDTTVTISTGFEVQIPKYRVRGYDLVTLEGEVFCFDEVVPGFAVDLAYLNEFSEDPTIHTNDWYYALADKPLDATEILTAYYASKDQTKDFGVWYVQGYNPELSDYDVVIGARGKSINGAYTKVLTAEDSNDNKPITCLYKDNQEIEIVSGYGVVYYQQNEEWRFYEFYLTDKEGKIYHVTIGQKLFDSSIDMDEEVTHAYYTEGEVSIGIKGNVATILALDDESRINLKFYISKVDDKIYIPAGEYTIDDSEQAGTMKASHGLDVGTSLPEESYFAYHEYIESDKMYNLTAVSCLVSGVAQVSNVDEQCHIVVDALNAKGKKIHLDITCPGYNLQDYDMDEDITHKYDSARVEVRTNMLDVIAFDNETSTRIRFFVSEQDENFFIPEGEYEINYSGNDKTVKASRGVNGLNYNIDYSFTGIMGENGLSKISCLVSGKIKVEHVENACHLIVDAKNSKGKTISLDITVNSAFITGIKTALADRKNATMKYIENGRIVIRRNGVNYDLNGRIIE